MKVIVATAQTMEMGEELSYTLGVFTSLDVFEKWLHENYIVDKITGNDNVGLPSISHYIYDKNCVTDGSGDYYHVYVEDVEEHKCIDVGQYVKLEEFEVI